MAMDELQAHEKRLHGPSSVQAIVCAFLASLGLLASLYPPSKLEWIWFAILWIFLFTAWLLLQRQGPLQNHSPLVVTAPAAAERMSDDADEGTESNAGTSSEETHFLSSAGHDLRQPLQAISLFSATLAAHDLPEPSGKLVSGIEAAVETLSMQFEEVMAIAKLEAGRIPLYPTVVPIRALLASCVAAQMGMAHEKDLHLRHMPTTLRVFADEAQLVHIIDRLIAHALRITETGGVLVGCRRRGERVSIQVWDSSQGIPPELQGEVFKPFSNYGQRLPDRALGLALSQRLTQRMGGELTLTVHPGKGNLFELFLPRATARHA